MVCSRPSLTLEFFFGGVYPGTGGVSGKVLVSPALITYARKLHGYYIITWLCYHNYIMGHFIPALHQRRYSGTFYKYITSICMTIVTSIWDDYL